MTIRTDRRAALPRLGIGRPDPLLFLGSALLIVLYWISLKWGTDTAVSSRFSRLFDVNGEVNIPAWYSSFLWILAAFRAYRLQELSGGGVGSARLAPYWLALSGICLYLSMDETAAIHESIGTIISLAAGDPDGVAPIYGWVWYGLALVALVGVAFARFLTLIPRDTATGLILGSVVFLAGAIGVETLGSLVDSGTIDWFPMGLNWNRAKALEELLEMLGICILVTVLGAEAARAGPAARPPLSGTPR